MKTLTHKDIEALPSRVRGNFVNSLSGFKGSQLLGTKSSKGIDNLAIISSTVHLGTDPALIGYIQRPVSVQRDSFENIMDTKFYTLSNIKESFYKEAHQTSARYDSDRSEFEACGLEVAYTQNGAPYVKDSSIVIEVEFLNKYPIEENGTVLMVGKIINVIMSEDYLFEDGTIDLEKAGSITASGLNSYHKTQRLSRLSYAKPDKMPEEIE